MLCHHCTWQLLLIVRCRHLHLVPASIVRPLYYMLYFRVLPVEFVGGRALVDYCCCAYASRIGGFVFYLCTAAIAVQQATVRCQLHTLLRD